MVPGRNATISGRIGPGHNVIRDTARERWFSDTPITSIWKGRPDVGSFSPVERSTGRPKYRASQHCSLDDLLTAVGTDRDNKAFIELFDHFQPRVQAQMVRRGLAPYAAADIAQDVMEAIWCKAKQFDRSKSAASTWVFSIAQNRRVDVHRRTREHTFDIADLSLIPDDRADNETSTDTAQRERHVHRALDALPLDQFKMVQLAFFEGLSHSTIAARTRIPVGTVKSRLRLAFSRMRRLLTDAGVTGAC
jgi:RNA polymerase sigma-70 factor (ECF subfamily)